MRFGAFGLTWLALVLAGLTFTAVPGVAQAADKPAAAAANPNLAEGSALAGLGFRVKPMILTDDGTFRDLMTRVAKDIHRSCGTLESFGWGFKGDEQTKVDGLTGALSSSLVKANFKVKPVTTKVANNPNVVISTADRTERRLLILWALSPPRSSGDLTQLVLLICDTTPKAK
jgi:hypothetical protein